MQIFLFVKFLYKYDTNSLNRTVTSTCWLDAEIKSYFLVVSVAVVWVAD